MFLQHADKEVVNICQKGLFLCFLNKYMLKLICAKLLSNFVSRALKSLT